MSNPQTDKKPQIQVKTSDEALKGNYATQIMISSSKEEFVMDFINLLPNSPVASLLSRIIISPTHAKRLALALNNQVKQYESNHGTVDSQEETKPVFGFQTE